jgi:tetratricopeptide (TPR) repeat protein
MDASVRLHSGEDLALVRARGLIEANRYADAIPLLRQAMQAQPESQEPRCLLAFSLHMVGQSRVGLQTARDAVLLDPEEEWPHRVQSVILAGMGRRKEALLAARQAASLEADHPHVLECLARAQQGMKQRSAARETAARLLHLAPDWESTHELLGDLALAASRWREAEFHYRRTLQLDPQSHSAMNNLGVALQRLNRKKEAIDCFHQAARISPTEQVSKINLYNSVRGYAGYGFLGVWLLIQTTRILMAHTAQLPADLRPYAQAGVILAAAAGAGGAWWWWRRRMRELHPTVTAFYRDEQQRNTRAALYRISVTVAITMGTLTTVTWSAIWATEGAVRAGLTSWPLAIFLLVAAGTLAGAGRLIARWRATRR